MFHKGFTYLTTAITVRLNARAGVPVFKGSMFRGVLGKAMHDLSCQKPGLSCDKCDGVINCPYANLFKPDLILKNQTVTVPFVLFCKDDREVLKPNDTVDLWITLFGDFIDYKDYFFRSFEFAGQIGLGSKQAPFEVVEIKEGSRQSLADIRPMQVKALRIHFLSPVSIFRDKKHIYAPRVEDIVEYVVHRVNRLNKSIWQVDDFSLERGLYEPGRLTVLKYSIAYSKRFKTRGLGSKVELSGFTGSMDISGDVVSVYPLLKAGEVLHIGSRTSYGLGKYDLIVL